MRNPADQLEQLLAPMFDARPRSRRPGSIATGLPAGPGAASGQIYLNADRAVAAADKGEKVLLVRVETSPEDLRGMIAAEGILTARGGVSSHAALVARQMGKVCVCGAAALEVDYQARTVKVDGKTFKEGDCLSIDGTAGKVYAGQVKTAPSEIVAGLIHGDAAAKKTEKFKNFQQLMKWCAQATRMVVRTNADTPEQTAQRDRLRRRRHRPHPHRAHVLRGRPHRRDARDDPRRRRREAAQGGARQAAALPARRLRRHLPALKGYPGDDPLPRSAAARVPAAHARSSRRTWRRSSASPVEQDPCSASQRAARVQPDARLPRLPPRHRVSRDHRDAGARRVRGRGADARRKASRSSPRS